MAVKNNKMSKPQIKTEITVTGRMTTRYTKMEKKYMRSVRIPTSPEYFCQVTTWVPDTPAYSKAPLICLTFSNQRDKIQLLFPSALDLHEFANIFQRFIDSQLKDINQAHMEALKDYTKLHDLLLKHADDQAKQESQKEFNNEKNDDHEPAPF